MRKDTSPDCIRDDMNTVASAWSGIEGLEAARRRDERSLILMAGMMRYGI
jgi:hypothetical protein